MVNNHTTPNSEPTTTYSPEFLNNYTLFLLKHEVSKKYISEYVQRTKQYIAFHSDQHNGFYFHSF